MRNLLILFICYMGTDLLRGQDLFNDYFVNNTLRIDYYHGGNATDEFISLDKIYHYKNWAGNPENCIQKSQLGEYRIEVFDTDNKKRIYSKGYTTIFWEYQTTNPAINGISRTYSESVFIPEPKQSVHCTISKKGKDRKYAPLFEFSVDPEDISILNEKRLLSSSKIINISNNGDPHQKVDIVVVSEGYTAKEFAKFKKDLNYYVEFMFTIEPYKGIKNKFNIYGIFTPSEESGPDEPRKDIYKNSVLNSSFNTFGTERYLLVDDNKSLMTYACQLPFDAIMVMVNSSRYGGGGIYNCQSVFTSDNPLRDYVFIHEFGHAFAGLADEYYSKNVAYVEFYPPGIEPVEANITALLDPENVKWKDLLSPGIDIPTDWNKEIYDSLNAIVSNIEKAKEDSVNALKKINSPESIILKVTNEFEVKIDEAQKNSDNFLYAHPLKDKVGVFEGAGYMSNGLYRPTINSLMQRFNENDVSFREVNERAILEMIKFYTGE